MLNSRKQKLLKKPAKVKTNISYLKAAAQTSSPSESLQDTVQTPQVALHQFFTESFLEQYPLSFHIWQLAKSYSSVHVSSSLYLLTLIKSSFCLLALIKSSFSLLEDFFSVTVSLVGSFSPSVLLFPSSSSCSSQSPHVSLQTSSTLSLLQPPRSLQDLQISVSYWSLHSEESVGVGEVSHRSHVFRQIFCTVLLEHCPTFL